MTLQDKLDEYKALPNPRILPEFRPIIGKSVADLVASGLADRALNVGQPAPDFSLPDQDANSSRLQKHWRKGRSSSASIGASGARSAILN